MQKTNVITQLIMLSYNMLATQLFRL